MPIDSPFDSLSGIRSPFGRRRSSAPLIITLASGGVSPSLGTLTDGDTVQSGLSAGALDTGNYGSSAGTIATVAEAVTINGTSGALTDTVAFEDVVSVSILVTDSAGNTQPFDAGTQTVQGIAPTADTAPVISGAQIGSTPSITPGTYSGVPTPTVLGAFTLDGAAFDPPTELQEADEGKTLAYVEEATNGIDPDAQQTVSAVVETPEVAFAWNGSQLILGNNQMIWDGQVLQLNSIRPSVPEVEPLVIHKTADTQRVWAPRDEAWYIDADGLWGNPRRDITITWEYDNPHVFQKLADDPDSLLTDVSANTSVGPNGFTVYQAPGTYYPKAKLRDRAGNEMVIDLPPIVVEDPDVYFAGAATTYFCRDGDFTGVPSDANKVTIADGNIGSEVTPGPEERYLYKRGETYEGGSFQYQHKNAMIGAWGTGTEPYFKYISLFTAAGGDATIGQGNSPGSAGVTISDVHFGSPYDPVLDADWTIGNEPPKPPQVNLIAGENSLLNNCKMIGIDKCRGVQSVFGCEVRNYFDYAFLGNLLNVAGNIIAQKPGVQTTLFTSAVDPQRDEWNGIYLEGSTPTGFQPGDEIPNNGGRHAPMRGRTFVGDACTYKNFFRNGGGHGFGSHQPAIRPGTPFSPGRPFEPTFTQNHVIGSAQTTRRDDRRVSRHPDSLAPVIVANIFVIWELNDVALSTSMGEEVYESNLFLTDAANASSILTYTPSSDSDGEPDVDRTEEMIFFRNNTVAFNNTNVDAILKGFGHSTAPQVLGLGNVLASTGNGWSSTIEAWSQNADLSELDANYVPLTGTTFDIDLYDYVVNEGPGAVLDFDGVLRSKPTKPGYKEFT